MKRALPSALVVATVALGLPGRVDAQPTNAGPAQTPEVLAPPEGSGPSPDVPEKPKRSANAAAGYAYADKPAAASKGAPHARYRRTGPVVNMPGFEQTGDGGSRLFVQLSQGVPVEERKTTSTITYVLKGASPRVYNNTNALVTVHFNTPVSRARLVPHGQDLHFVVELRAAVAPTWRMSEGADKSATLAIEFPKGDYLAAAPAPAPEAATTARRAPPKAARGKRGAGKAAPAAPPASAAEPPKP